MNEGASSQEEGLHSPGRTTRMPRTVLCSLLALGTLHMQPHPHFSLWSGSLTLKIFLSKLYSLKLNDPSQGIRQAFVTQKNKKQKNNFQGVNPLKLYYDILVWSFCWLFLSQVLMWGRLGGVFALLPRLASNLFQFCGSLPNPGITGTHYQVWQ